MVKNGKKYLTIDEYIQEFERHKIIFANKPRFLGWLFEYACQRTQYENKDPKTSGEYIKLLVLQKMEDVLEETKKIYEKHADLRYFVLKTPRYDLIPRLIRGMSCLGVARRDKVKTLEEINV